MQAFEVLHACGLLCSCPVTARETSICTSTVQRGSWSLEMSGVELGLEAVAAGEHQNVASMERPRRSLCSPSGGDGIRAQGSPAFPHTFTPTLSIWEIPTHSHDPLTNCCLLWTPLSPLMCTFQSLITAWVPPYYDGLCVCLFFLMSPKHRQSQ